MTPKQFRKARLRLGLNQTEFAAALGLRPYPQLVSGKERGTKPITERDRLIVEALLRQAE